MNECLDGNLNLQDIECLMNEAYNSHRERKEMGGRMVFHKVIKHVLYTFVT